MQIESSSHVLGDSPATQRDANCRRAVPATDAARQDGHVGPAPVDPGTHRCTGERFGARWVGSFPGPDARYSRHESVGGSGQKSVAATVQRHHVGVIDRRAPVLVHSWLSTMYRNGDRELVGSIELDSADRPPRHNGDRSAEILVEVGLDTAGPELSEHLDACADRIRHALDHLPELTRYVCRHAPREWVRYQSAQPGSQLIDRIFLDGFEVSSQGLVSLAFDFGDLDMLILRLDRQGSGQAVLLRP